jgi:phosphomevalonate kinase
MGSLADVPIEPEEQTSILNATIALPGVIGGGVPGGRRLRLLRRVADD